MIVTYTAVNGHLYVIDKEAKDQGLMHLAVHSAECDCYGEDGGISYAELMGMDW